MVENTTYPITVNSTDSRMQRIFAILRNDCVNEFCMNRTGDLQDQYAPDSMQPIHQSEDLNATFNALATSMSNSIRSNANNGTPVIGTVGVTVYNIYWTWICIPFIGFCGGSCFLSLTIFRTKAHDLHLWNLARSLYLSLAHRQSPFREKTLARGWRKGQRRHISHRLNQLATSDKPKLQLNCTPRFLS